MALLPFLADLAADPVFLVLFIVAAFLISSTQGYILGTAILQKFPRLQNHAKISSILLFFLFLANAFLSVPRFASPEKIDLTKLFETRNSVELLNRLYSFWSKYGIFGSLGNQRYVGELGSLKTHLS